MAECCRGFGNTVPRAIAVVLQDNHGSIRRNSREEIDNNVDRVIAERLQKARFPIAMQAGRPKKICHPLRIVVWHRLEHVGERGSVCTQRTQDLLPFYDVSGVDAAKTNKGRSSHWLWCRRVIGHMEQKGALVGFIRCFSFKVTPTADGIAPSLCRVQ